MKKMGHNKLECIKKLSLYRDKMEKILSLVENNLPLFGTDEEKAQSLLEGLKQSLELDLDRISSGEGRTQMSSFERDYYLPAIYEATKRISVETDSTPSEEWIDDIELAQKYINIYLNQLLSKQN
jgi:hypothetical protein